MKDEHRPILKDCCNNIVNTLPTSLNMFKHLNSDHRNNNVSVVFDFDDVKPRGTKKLLKFQQGRVIHKVVALLTLLGGACVLNHLTNEVISNIENVEKSNEKWRTEIIESYHVLTELLIKRS